LVGFDPHLDVVIDHAFDGHQDLHKQLQKNETSTHMRG
jgi:hypothetical protein